MGPLLSILLSMVEKLWDKELRTRVLMLNPFSWKETVFYTFRSNGFFLPSYLLPLSHIFLLKTMKHPIISSPMWTNLKTRWDWWEALLWLMLTTRQVNSALMNVYSKRFWFTLLSQFCFCNKFVVNAEGNFHYLSSFLRHCNYYNRETGRFQFSSLKWEGYYCLSSLAEES